MLIGEIHREDLLKALQALGGQPRTRGGETILAFRGTTITVGRRDFSRRMLRRVERKLLKAGIEPPQLYALLRRRAG